MSRESAFVSFPGSWFKCLILDGKKESLYALVLQYGTLSLYWRPLKLEVWRGWYSYHGMCNTEHHNGLGLLSSVLECFARKALDHGSDTAGVAKVSCYKSGCSPMNSFYLFDVVYWVWVPDCGRIFHFRIHKCSVAGVLDFLWAC